MKRILIILTLLLSLQCFAQTDTVFWFAPPALNAAYGRTPVRLVFHTYDQPATITIEQPAGSALPASTITLAANSHHAYDLSPVVSLIETAPTNTVLNRGIRIAASAPITCYYQSTSSNRETYTLKGRNALGTAFQIIDPDIPHGPDMGQRLEIVATEDSTAISVTTAHSTQLLGGIGPDSTVHLLLHRGQCYALQCTHYGISTANTRIQSNRPIAVNITADGCPSFATPGATATYNLAGEQLLPLTHWGTRHVRIKHTPTTDVFNCMGHNGYSDFSVWTEGTPPTVVNSPGSHRIHCGAGDTSGIIVSERPMGVLHQIAPNQMTAATVLPHLDCAGSHKVSYLRSGDLPLSIHLVVSSSAVQDLRLNGDSTILTADLFRTVPDMPSLVWCNTEIGHLLPPDSTVTISCSSTKFILGVIEGDNSNGTSYTYLTDYAPYSHIEFSMDSLFCSGDSIHFGFYTHSIDSIAIHGPNGLTIPAPPYLIPFADTTMGGQYVVEGFSRGNDCHQTYLDTIRIQVSPAPYVELSDTISPAQLPWRRFDTLFLAETDTLLRRPDTNGGCDSLIHYRLLIPTSTYDTIYYYACPNELPVQFDSLLLYHDTQVQFTYRGSMGQDSNVTFILHVKKDSDSTLYDTIVDTQLPWTFNGVVFEDSATNHPIVLTNNEGCDSTIHYNLFIFWNGDRCDTTLTYPNYVTANGDGHNDKFVIQGLIENACFKYNQLSIFDRSGHRVYHKTNIASDADWWDPAADRMPSGTYFYYFKAHGVAIHTQHTGLIEVFRED